MKPPTSFDLEGHRALVTGFSRGIGAAIALALAEAGADVMMHYTGNTSAPEDIAYGSIRMEPVFMVLAQAAATAAGVALKQGNLPVQDVPYAQLRAGLEKGNQVLAWDDATPHGDGNDSSPIGR